MIIDGVIIIASFFLKLYSHMNSTGVFV